MTVLEVIASVVGTAIGLTVLAGVFVRVVALPYLTTHLVTPLLERLDLMTSKDADLAAKDMELEASYKLAAYMFEGHMNASETDRGHLWDAVNELRQASHRH